MNLEDDVALIYANNRTSLVFSLPMQDSIIALAISSDISLSRHLCFRKTSFYVTKISGFLFN